MLERNSRQSNWILLDAFRRKFFLKIELKRIILKTLIATKSNITLQMLYAYYLLIHLPQWGHWTRTSSRCLLSGRRHGLNNRWKLSRFQLRLQADLGYLPLVRRGSW